MYKYFLRNAIKKTVNNSERKRAYHNLKEIKSILVLFDTENMVDANHFIQQMKKMDKKVKALAYKSKNDTQNYSNISYTIVTDKEMKYFKGDSLVQIINGLTDEKFDLIVDFTLKENLLLLYILVSTNSPLKVGFYKHPLPVHDIVISFASGFVLTVEELGAHLIHYLSVISSEEEK